MKIRMMIDKGKKEFAELQGYTVLQIPNASPAQISNIPQELKESYCESNEAAIAIIMGSSE